MLSFDIPSNTWSFFRQWSFILINLIFKCHPNHHIFSTTILTENRLSLLEHYRCWSFGIGFRFADASHSSPPPMTKLQGQKTTALSSSSSSILVLTWFLPFLRHFLRINWRGDILQKFLQKNSFSRPRQKTSWWLFPSADAASQKIWKVNG